jgi:hypothetical protein
VTVATGSTTAAPTVPGGSATTPNRSCPPGQARKGRC